MKFLVTLSALAVLTGCATNQDLDQTNKTVATHSADIRNLNSQLLIVQAQLKAEAAKPRVASGCYLAGNLYSLNAVVAGRKCANSKSFDDRNEDQWEWVPDLR